MKPSSSSSKKRGKKKKKPKPSSPSPPQSQSLAVSAELRPAALRLADDEDEKKRALDVEWLMDAFSSLSLDQISSAYIESGHDPFKAAGILGSHLVDPDAKVVVVGVRKEKRKMKKKGVAAASGMVADVIGKGYVKPLKSSSSSSSNCGSSSGGEGRVVVGELEEEEGGKKYSVEEGEEFLCSMLGDDADLGMAVVKDVLCQCGYDVEKALDVLLDISASSFNQRDSGDFSCAYPELSLGGPQESIFSFQFTDKSSYSTDHSSDKENDFLQFEEYDCRNNTRDTASTEEQPSSSSSVINPDIQQKVLESLFNISGYTRHEPTSMNWKKVVKQVESFGQGLEYRNGITEPHLNARTVKEDEYRVCRSDARKHWDTMRTYYQKAAVAYSSGERANAAQLSETGRLHSKLAREADEKASREIFEARNKDIKNVVTIDLHGQHVKQGIRLLKLHLLLFAYIPSIQFLKVITGRGADGAGRGKIKQSVISLAKKEGIEWCEENSGTLLLRIDGLKEYSFVDEDDDDGES